MKKAKPCPRCGSKELEIFILNRQQDLNCGGTVRCKDCGVFFYDIFVKDDLIEDALIRSWNKLKAEDIHDIK